MHILTFSGWAQSPFSLDGVIPSTRPSCSIHHVDYSLYPAMKALDAALPAFPVYPDMVIGWSLGGQIALDVLYRGLIKPKLLVLLSSSLYFDHPDFSAFTHAFQANPEATCKRFRLMMAEGDTHAKSVIQALAALPPCRFSTLPYWLQQLQALDHRLTAFDFAFPVIALHGAHDRIIPVSALKEMRRISSQFKSYIFPDAAHAPQFHDPLAVQHIIHAEIAHSI